MRRHPIGTPTPEQLAAHDRYMMEAARKLAAEFWAAKDARRLLPVSDEQWDADMARNGMWAV